MFSLRCYLKHMKCYANSIVISYYQLSEFTVIRPLIIFLFSLHLGIQSGPCEDQLIKLDEQCSEKTYKVFLRQNLKIAECSGMWIFYYLCQIFIWSFLFSVILVARWVGIIIVCFVPLFHALILGTQYSTNDFASLLLGVFKTLGVAQDMDWEYTQ